MVEDYKFTVTFFDVGGGDAVWIRFVGLDAKWHNILIDGGYGYAYKRAFGPLIRHLAAINEPIDLWVVSHIDRDHIGAVLGFIGDSKVRNKSAIVKEFWFNHSEINIKPPGDRISVSDGINFRKYLSDNGLLLKDSITTKIAKVDLHGLKIDILSPTPEGQAKVDSLWKIKEHGGNIGRSSSEADHIKTIEELNNNVFMSDTNDVNGSSIALLLEYESVKCILLADSHPADIVTSLIRLGYTQEAPLKANFMQLAHHGSKANTSPELLELIKTANFIITGNGIHNRHPDKETLVRILTQKHRDDVPLHFQFVCDTNDVRNLFSVDEHPFDRYNFTCSFPKRDSNGIRLMFLPNTCNNE